MPVFRYKAVASDGQVLSGEIEAPTKESAIAKLQGSGYLPISADEINSKHEFFRNFISRFKKTDTASSKDIIVFTRELATLLEAGLPLDGALDTMANISSSPAVKTLVTNVHNRVREGIALSDAMAEQGGIFNRLYLNMIRAGEAGGSMQLIIDRLADYMERMGELRSTIVTALIYPAILLIISFLSLFVMLTFVVPKFVPLFDDVGQALPLLTQVVFGVAGLFQGYWWALLFLLALGAWIFDKQIADTDKRLRFDAWMLDLPYLGELIKQMEITRFTRTLGTLLTNGVPVLSAVTLVRDVISNSAISGVMDAVVASLAQGQRLARPLKESNYFPVLAVQLIEIGEESGQLESMLMKIADIYDKEIQTSIKRLLALFEPVLIVGLGGLIAIIIFSILQPMLGLTDLIG